MNTKKSSVSVAMATYNGEAFLLEQLNSILAQSEPPTEVIVVDDCSSDQTLTILREFAQTAACPIKVVVNSQNQGSAESFAKAISLCQGDYIALADQDDVWTKDKLATLLECVSENSFGAVFSDAWLVDQDLKSLDLSLFDNSQVTASMRKQFRVGQGHLALMRYNVVTGATLMFHRRHRDLILPIEPGWVHDYWIALLISSCEKIGMCERKLIYYRQHQCNQIGMKQGLDLQIRTAKNKPSFEYRDEARLFELLEARLVATRSGNPLFLSHIRAKIAFLNRRYRLRSSPVSRIPLFIYNLFRNDYFRYGQGLKPLLKDCLLP